MMALHQDLSRLDAHKQMGCLVHWREGENPQIRVLSHNGTSRARWGFHFYGKPVIRPIGQCVFLFRHAGLLPLNKKISSSQASSHNAGALGG